MSGATRTARRSGMGRSGATLLTLLLGVLLLAGCTGAGGFTTTAPAQWMTTAAEPDVVVIDVRTPQEYAAGHVDGAVNIDVEAPDFSTRIGDLDPAGTYALYCRSGNRSAVAAGTMAEAGFTDIHNLKGGISDLQAAGAPIVAP